MEQAVQRCCFHLFSAYQAAQASLAAQHLRTLLLALVSWALGMEAALLGRRGLCEHMEQVVQRCCVPLLHTPSGTSTMS